MNVLVTGGSGFVGSRVVPRLRAEGHQVVALVRSERAAAAVRALGAVPISGDLLDASTLPNAVAGRDVVVHLAADMTPGGSARALMRSNAEGTRALAREASRAGVRRFVHLSAASVVYEDKPMLDVDDATSPPARAVGPYSASKLAAERAIEDVGLEHVHLRPPAIWGRGDNHLLPAVLDLARKGQLVLAGGGDFPFSTCHVENVAEAVSLAVGPGGATGAFFLTDGEPRTQRAFLEALLVVSGVSARPRAIPRFAARAAASALAAAFAAVGSGAPPLSPEILALMGPSRLIDRRARQVLGYSSPFTFERGLAELREQEVA